MLVIGDGSQRCDIEVAFVFQCDVLIIGAGVSGVAAAGRLADFGLKV